MSKRGRRKPNKTGRNEEVQFWNVPYSLAKSDAFRQLPGPALKILVELRTRFNGYNNGKITLSMDEAARLLGMSKSTVVKALADLQAMGFIKIRVKGQWYGRKASQWTLTMCPLDGQPATNEWKNWKALHELKEAKKTIPRYPNGTPACFDGAG